MRWLRRLTAIVGAVVGAGCAAMLAAPAAAADGLDDWTPRDTSGIPITEYRLSFNNGAGVFGAVFTPDTTVPAALAYVLFALFLASAWIGFMTLNILLLADWLSPLVRTIDGTANRLYEQIGLPFILFIVTATLLATAALWFLRNQGNRLWHHTAVTVVCVIIGASIAFPVAEAAKMLGIGRDAAVDVGSSLTGGTLDKNSAGGQQQGAVQQQGASNPTGVLVDEWVRKPVQRWTFGGQDMDSLGCGEEWNKRIRAKKPDEIKDAPLSCPGGVQGQQMHDAAMNPQSAIVDSAVTTIFGVVMAVLLVTVVVTLIGVSVVALIHAGLIKIGMMGAGVESGQNFLVRNSVDAPIAGVMFFAGLLGVYIAAAVAKIMAEVVPSSTAGMLLTIVILASAGLGIRKVIRNLKAVPRRVSRTRGAPGAPGSALVRTQTRQGRALARRAVSEYKTKRSTKRAAGMIAAAVAPEIAAPTAAASRVRAAAQSMRRGGSGSGRATQTAGAAGGGGWPAGGGYGPAPAYVAADSAGGGWMAVPLSAGQYARAAASQYRTSRAAMSAPSGPQGQRVAGRTRRPAQPAMAAAGPAGASAYAAGPDYSAAGYGPAGAPMGTRNGPSESGAAAGGGRRSAGRTQGGTPRGGVRSASGTADAARAMARTYRSKGRS